jgi:hypothetical protein
MFLFHSRWRGRLSALPKPGVAEPACNLKPAATSEIAEVLSRAALCESGQLVHDADLIIGRVTAARLVEHLRGAGFMIVKTGAGPVHGNSAIPAPSP